MKTQSRKIAKPQKNVDRHPLVGKKHHSVGGGFSKASRVDQNKRVSTVPILHGPEKQQDQKQIDLERMFDSNAQGKSENEQAVMVLRMDERLGDFEDRKERSNEGASQLSD